MVRDGVAYAQLVALKRLDHAQIGLRPAHFLADATFNASVLVLQRRDMR